IAGFGHVQKANGMRLAFGYGYNPEQFAFLWNERAFGWNVAIAIYKIIPAGFLWYGFIAMPEILADHFVIGALVIAFQERSEEHTSELQSLMRISYAVFCL